MLDLSQELEGFDEGDDKESACSCSETTYGLHRKACPKNPRKTGRTLGKLSDLQEQGFNRKPSCPSQIPKMWQDNKPVPANVDELIHIWKDSEESSTQDPYTLSYKVNMIPTSNRCVQCRRYMPEVTTSGTPVYCDECSRMRG